MMSTKYFLNHSFLFAIVRTNPSAIAFVPLIAGYGLTLQRSLGRCNINDNGTI